MNRRLVLFDIDGTLIASGTGARKALTHAIHDVLNIQISVTVQDTAGKTDKWIIKDLAVNAGISEADALSSIDSIIEVYIRNLQRFYNQENDARMFPGVLDILSSLEDLPYVQIGLLTGNVERGAQIKLSPFDISKYFAFGAFGDDALYRNDLPAIAVQRANELYNTTYTEQEIVIVGDTVYDVLCSKIISAKSIIVCRRPEWYQDIANHHPDFVFSNFNDYESVVEAILS